MSVSPAPEDSRDQTAHVALVGFEQTASAAAIADGLATRGFRATCASSPVQLVGTGTDPPDVCLITLDGAQSELDRLAELVQSSCAIAAVTSSPGVDEMLRCLTLGARAYLVSPIDDDRLALAIRVVIAGATVLPNDLAAIAAKDLWETPFRRKMVIDGREVALTLREWEVVELMRKNLSTSQIASRMYVSPVTVRTHISSIVKKLSVRDRNAALQLLR